MWAGIALLAWPLLSSGETVGNTGGRHFIPMAPILINAAASVASNVIDSISEHFSKHQGVRKASKVAHEDFDAELAKTQNASATAGTTTPVDTQGALMTQVLGSPEVSTALAGANPAQPVQVEMSSSGGISLRNASGELHALKVSDSTRDLVSKLYSAHQSSVIPGKDVPTAVLAVDPTRTLAATWSNLPARAA